MQEKDMVNDTLSQVKSSLVTYAQAITECANTQLRQTYQTIRNGCETFQYDLYRLAEQKGYCKPAAPADYGDITTVKSEFNQ